MIFWWFPRFCLIFSFEAKPSKIIEKSSKNHRFAWKTMKIQDLASFLVFFKQNDYFSMFFWWFFDDFWRFCFKRENQTKPRKSSTNYQKIIVLLEKPWKFKILASFLVLIKQNDDFWMIFEGFASKEKIKQNLGNHQKIIKKSSRNHRFAWKTMKIQDFVVFGFFKQNDDFLIIFWWFFDDFLGFVWFSLLKQNLQKSS